MFMLPLHEVGSVPVASRMQKRRAYRVFENNSKIKGGSVGSGERVALAGCLLPGSGGRPWPHSPPQAIHGLLSATPRQGAASVSGWLRVFYEANHDDRWELAYLGIEQLSETMGLYLEPASRAFGAFVPGASASQRVAGPTTD